MKVQLFQWRVRMARLVSSKVVLLQASCWKVVVHSKEQTDFRTSDSPGAARQADRVVYPEADRSERRPIKHLVIRVCPFSSTVINIRMARSWKGNMPQNYRKSHIASVGASLELIATQVVRQYVTTITRT